MFTGDPYLGAFVEDNITFHQNNHFANNTYTGPWRFTIHEQNQLRAVRDLAGIALQPGRREHDPLILRAAARVPAVVPAPGTTRVQLNSAQTRSMMMAGAMPPPAHMVISANWPSRRSSSSSAVPISMLPVAPIG